MFFNVPVDQDGVLSEADVDELTEDKLPRFLGGRIHYEAIILKPFFGLNLS